MSFSVHTLAAIAGLIVTSLSLELSSQPREEIITECICWCLILLCGKAYLQFVVKAPRPFNSAELGTIAFSATLLCLTTSVQQTLWSTAPLLGPALILIEKGTTLLPEYEEPTENKEAAPTLLGAGKKKMAFLGAYAFVTMIALFRGDPLTGFHLKLLWLFSQLVLYWGLFHRVSQTNSTKLDTFTETLHTITELASYMALAMVPLTILFWHGAVSVPHVGIAGIMKAGRWACVLYLAHDSKISVAAWTTIFAVCTNAIWVYPHGWQTGLTLIAAFAALYRIATTFPQSSVGKWIVLAFALCPLWAFGIQNGVGSKIPSWSSTPAVGHGTTWTSTHHPIFHLHEEARASLEEMKLRQSKTFDECVAEYKRRYGRSPPPGFDEWYKFAVENEIPLIDEYDFLTHSLDPFFQIPPNILREWVDQALEFDGSNMNMLTVESGEARLSRGSFQHRQIVELLQPIQHMLPDFKAALNEYDEPRVLVPYDVLNGNPHRYDPPKTEAQPVNFATQDRQEVWNSATLSCPPDSLARQSVIEPQPDDPWPKFISNLSESQDICLWPATETTKHGFLGSPSTFHYTDRLAPLMATAKLSTFQDIMIPSSYYFQEDIYKYDESKDIPFSQKKDVVYWRGTGTGGHWTKGSWKKGHRQRFVDYTNSPDEEIKLLSNEASGKWTAYTSTMSEMLDKFKVKFSRFIQCDDEDCKGQEEYFKKANLDSNDDAVQYKVLYNLDGNSFSGRYYRFLKSNSLVFMQALFKEWHDDRIIPWVHFVPISLDMGELPETTRYLLDDPEGKIIAARIASESREWTRKTLRQIDLTAAYFRTFLEYARLLDDNRSALM